MSDSKEFSIEQGRVNDEHTGPTSGVNSGSARTSQKLDVSLVPELSLVYLLWWRIQLTVQQRYLSLKPAVAFGMTVLSSWTGISLTVGSAFLNGGPTTLIWGTILAGVGTLCIAASLGELASM